jgi:hypothetical protein
VYRLRVEWHIRAERELQERVAVALAHTGTLRGPPPICARCKRVRDDKGYWHQIDASVSEHSHAEFSRGICPDRLAKVEPQDGWSSFSVAR